MDDDKQVPRGRRDIGEGGPRRLPRSTGTAKRRPIVIWMPRASSPSALRFTCQRHELSRQIGLDLASTVLSFSSTFMFSYALASGERPQYCVGVR